LREIAAATFDPLDYPVVMREVWESLNHAGKNWRQIFKVSSTLLSGTSSHTPSDRDASRLTHCQGLTLLDTLVKHGSERVVDDARDHLFRIRTLTDFTHHQDGGDKGAGVREKAKALVELLNDNLRIREEREQARRLRDKYVGISNVGAPAAISLSSATAYKGDDSWERRGADFSSRGGGGGGSDGGRNRADWRSGGGSAAESSSRALHLSDAAAAPASGTGGGRSHHHHQRRGRRPAGAGDIGEGGGDVPNDATVADLPPASDFSHEFAAAGGVSGDADFDAFGPVAPSKPDHAAAAASTKAAAPPAGGRLQVNIRPSTGAGPAPVLRPPPPAASTLHTNAPKSAPPAASATLDDFGLFAAAAAPAAAPPPAASDWSDFATAPQPQPTVSAPEPFDPFSGAPAPAAKPSAAAVLAAAYDPFASPLPASQAPPSQGGLFGGGGGGTFGGADPFAGTPGMNLAAAMAAAGPSGAPRPAASAAGGADEFGGFASATVKDDDVDRLFLAGGLSLGTKAAAPASGVSAAAGGAKKAVPLNAIAPKTVPSTTSAMLAPVQSMPTIGSAPGVQQMGRGTVWPPGGGFTSGPGLGGPQGGGPGWQQPYPGMAAPGMPVGMGFHAQGFPQQFPAGYPAFASAGAPATQYHSGGSPGVFPF
jgi:epsin